MKTREELEKELAQLEKKHAQRNEQAAADRKRAFTIERELWMLGLIPLIDVVDGVMLRTRGANPKLPDDVVGTLRKVNRVRCDVEFGVHGSWSYPAKDLMPTSSTASQGFALSFGAIK